MRVEPRSCRTTEPMMWKLACGLAAWAPNDVSGSFVPDQSRVEQNRAEQSSTEQKRQTGWASVCGTGADDRQTYFTGLLASVPWFRGARKRRGGDDDDDGQNYDGQQQQSSSGKGNGLTGLTGARQWHEIAVGTILGCSCATSH